MDAAFSSRSENSSRQSQPIRPWFSGVVRQRMFHSAETFRLRVKETKTRLMKEDGDFAAEMTYYARMRQVNDRRCAMIER